MIKRAKEDNLAFAARAEEKITDVLSQHNLRHSAFRTDDRNPAARFATFSREDGEFEIVILEDITMRHGDQLFECYLRREFASDDTLIECFARRLDRFLSGGHWKEPDER